MALWYSVDSFLLIFPLNSFPFLSSFLLICTFSSSSHLFFYSLSFCLILLISSSPPPLKFLHSFLFSPFSPSIRFSLTFLLFFIHFPLQIHFFGFIFHPCIFFLFSFPFTSACPNFYIVLRLSSHHPFYILSRNFSLLPRTGRRFQYICIHWWLPPVTHNSLSSSAQFCNFLCFWIRYGNRAPCK